MMKRLAEPAGTGTARSGKGQALRAMLLLLLFAGCAQRDSGDTRVDSDVATPWPEVIAQAKAFTYRIGFVPTANFTHASQDLRDFPFCGRASRLLLPYSYEDPAIEWVEAATPRECREAADTLDVYHGMSEAVGEIATPVTPAMIASGVPRMVYLVVHEDCHDQFTLPYGIEEPLCELISYRAMTAIAALPGPWSAAERRAIRDYALRNSGRIPLNLHYYQQAAELYARHARGELAEQALLRERAVLFARAETSTGSPAGSLNNVVLANRMTYARHHPSIERIFDRLGSDIGRLVAFFQQVDAVVAAAPAVAGTDVSVVEPDSRADPARSGPRQRATTLAPTRSSAGRSTGGFRQPRPTDKATARTTPGTVRPGGDAAGTRPGPAAPPAARPAAEPDAASQDVESPAVLLARIRAAEAAVLDTAQRLLDTR
jgi:hypothetical protein